MNPISVLLKKTIPWQSMGRSGKLPLGLTGWQGARRADLLSPEEVFRAMSRRKDYASLEEASQLDPVKLQKLNLGGGLKPTKIDQSLVAGDKKALESLREKDYARNLTSYEKRQAAIEQRAAPIGPKELGGQGPLKPLHMQQKDFRELLEKDWKVSRVQRPHKVGLTPTMDFIEQHAPTLAQAMKVKNPSPTAQALQKRVLGHFGNLLKGPGGSELKKKQLTRSSFLKTGSEELPVGELYGDLPRFARFKDKGLSEAVFANYKVSRVYPKEETKLIAIGDTLRKIERSAVKKLSQGREAVTKALHPETIGFMAKKGAAEAAQKEKSAEVLIKEFEKHIGQITPQMAQIARREAQTLARDSPDIFRALEDKIMQDVIIHAKRFPVGHTKGTAAERKELRRIFRKKLYTENPQNKLIYADRYLESSGMAPIRGGVGDRRDQWQRANVATKSNQPSESTRIYAGGQQAEQYGLSEAMGKEGAEYIEVAGSVGKSGGSPLLQGGAGSDSMPSRQIPSGIFDKLRKVMGEEKTEQVWNVLNQPMFTARRFKPKNVEINKPISVSISRRNLLRDVQPELTGEEMKFLLDEFPYLLPK